MRIQELPQHHALLIIDENRKELFEELSAELPSFTHFVLEQTVFDIESAKKFIAWTNTPRQEKAVALISFHTTTIPAQNALLKMLEEPTEYVRFILITTNKENLLPTFISRTQVMQTSSTGVLVGEDVQTFLTTKPLLRMKLPSVMALLEGEDEEGRKDREQVRLFLLLLAETLGGMSSVNPDHLKEVLLFSAYAQDPSSSGKALLEYVSLLLPKYDTIS